MHKCPNCGFEPVDGRAICPNCGFELTAKNDRAKKNDEIEWSELASMPIDSVKEMFSATNDESPEDNEGSQDELKIVEKKAEHLPETEASFDRTNPILEQYIREHKEESEKLKEKSSAEEKAEAERKALIEAEQAKVIAAEQAKAVADETRSLESHKESNQEPPKKGKKGRNIAIAAVILVALLGGGGYYYSYQQDQAAEEAAAEKAAADKKTNQAIDEIEAEITDFYTNSKQVFLKVDKVDTNTAKIAEEINQYKKNDRYKELKNSYDTLTAKQKDVQAVNNLFTSTAINGDILASDLKLKAAEDVTVTVDTKDNQFNDLLNEAINQAKTQYDQIIDLRNSVSTLITNGTVASTATRSTYNATMQKAGTVPNQELITDQVNQLAEVNQTLTEWETAASESASRAEKEEETTSSSESSTSSPSYSMSGNNQPIMSTNQSQVADSGNSAWSWNSGVREKFLQTVIDRGYVTEGGYSLVPVQIQGGEGYYNLFATNNQSDLTKGYTSADLPMYVVTVNCKTGWFKGNGGGGSRS